MAVILPFLLSLVISVPTIGVSGIVVAVVITLTIQVLRHPSRTAHIVESRLAGTWAAADEVIEAFFGHHASAIKRTLTVVTIGVVWCSDAVLIGLASMFLSGDRWNQADPPQSYTVAFTLTLLAGLWLTGVVIVRAISGRGIGGRAIGLRAMVDPIGNRHNEGRAPLPS